MRGDVITLPFVKQLNACLAGRYLDVVAARPGARTPNTAPPTPCIEGGPQVVLQGYLDVVAALEDRHHPALLTLISCKEIRYFLDVARVTDQA